MEKRESTTLCGIFCLSTKSKTVCSTGHQLLSASIAKVEGQEWSKTITVEYK